jgi:hypothetical protein
MKKLVKPMALGFLTLGCLLLLWTPAFAYLDLGTWTKRGPAGNGTWTVSGTGNTMVTQIINGNPTFFVSPNDYLNVEVKGKMKVATTGDDDLIGFAFGYKSPLDTSNNYDLYLFDWKQADQDVAKEGFALSRVKGTIASYSPFWARVDDLPEYDNLAKDYGSTRGWADNTEYAFTLLYLPNQIKIDIKGGTGDFKDGLTIFDLNGSFPSGRLAFYNYSQQSAQYYNVEVTVIPLPGAVWLLGGGLAGLVAWRRKTRS